MSNKRSMINRAAAVILAASMLLSSLSGCGSQTAKTSESSISTETSFTDETSAPNIDTQEIAEQISEELQFVEELQSETDIGEIAHALIVNEYSAYYDVFDAAIVLEDGTEIPGIGYSDFGSYFSSEDGGGYFAAGFLPAYGEMPVPKGIDDRGLKVYNLEYEDDNYGFVYAYETESFMEHCVINDQYLKYGVDENGVITYEAQPYERGYCDEDLGVLYSYDEERYVYNPNVGDYKNISGTSLFVELDYDALEEEVNRILTDQDYAFSQEEINSAAYFAQDAMESYLLSCQEETFLGCDVGQLIAEVQNLDPTEFIRITPEGYVVIPIEDEIPETPSAVAKWVVGISCGIVVIGSTALSVFVPAARPASGAITGAAIEVFMQVVVENRAVSNIQWSKVAVSAVSGALMAWACPLGAAAVTTSVGQTTGSLALSKLAGYGVLTLSNAVVSGATNAAFAIIDKQSKGDVWNAFLMGAAVGACCTAAASLLAEAGAAVGNAVNAKFPNNFMAKAGEKVSTFIGNHQVHLSNSTVEDILNPKSVYAAAKAAHEEYLRQSAQAAATSAAEDAAEGTATKQGGRYADLVNDGTDRHEMPCFSSTDAEIRKDGPAIKMDPADHKLTASYGSSAEAREYQAAQRELVQAGNYHDAIQMDIDDIHAKFGDKYDDAIAEMLEYAQSIVWW